VGAVLFEEAFSWCVNKVEQKYLHSVQPTNKRRFPFVARCFMGHKQRPKLNVLAIETQRDGGTGQQLVWRPH